MMDYDCIKNSKKMQLNFKNKCSIDANYHDLNNLYFIFNLFIVRFIHKLKIRKLYAIMLTYIIFVSETAENVVQYHV